MVRHHSVVSVAVRWLAAMMVVLSSSVVYFLLTYPTISLSSVLVKMVHPGAVVSGTVLSIDGVAVEFIRACIAPSAYVLLIVLLLLTPGLSFKTFFAAMLSGVALLLVLNVVRIFVLIELLVVKGVNYFQAVHLLFWMLLSSVAVALVWIFLVHRFTIRQIPVYDDLVTVYTRLSMKK